MINLVLSSIVALAWQAAIMTSPAAQQIILCPLAGAVVAVTYVILLVANRESITADENDLDVANPREYLTLLCIGPRSSQ